MDDFDLLTTLGLTKTQCRCYALLVKHKTMSTPELAEQLNVSRTGLYLPLKQLSHFGFAKTTKVPGFDRRYRVNPLNEALETYFEYLTRQVSPLFCGLPHRPSRDLRFHMAVRHSKPRRGAWLFDIEKYD